MNTQIDTLTAVVEQFEIHWKHQLESRLSALTDDEYFFDPTHDRSAWTVHSRDHKGAAVQGGSGEMVIDFEFPEPDPAPFTTIAWRLGHVIVGVLAVRNHDHLGAPEASYMTWDYSPTAAGAIEQLEHELDVWFSGIRSFDADRLAAPCGPAEGEWADRPMLSLILHINRELIHHLSEVSLLRDLYAHTR
ncbi:DinB family protein [Kocuria sp. JC486]|uniref:DinB family protein n=1 Tax=Kocuria soli TaxID=2485125 RepID=A0A3N3ZR64_9MICC|nr:MULTISPECIES: DinB family protein [Kocuria]NHU86113.1 DinB family protein [Kocuria sp. JC486]ROZ62164.1 DinB family protein [Kocuria soli]